MIPSDQRLPPRCDDPCQIAPSTPPTTVPKVIVYKFYSEPKNQTIYNIIRWFAGLLGQMTH